MTFTTWTNERYVSGNLKKMAKRAKLAATFILPGSSVLDLGCGHQFIREHLPTGCSYLGIDLYPVGDDVPVYDLDAHQFPDGRWDYVLALGLLGALKEKLWTLQTARERATHLILTCYSEGYDGPHANKDGRAELVAAGWTIKEKREFRDNRRGAPIDVLLCE